MLFTHNHFKACSEKVWALILELFYEMIILCLRCLPFSLNLSHVRIGLTMCNVMHPSICVVKNSNSGNNYKIQFKLVKHCNDFRHLICNIKMG